MLASKSALWLARAMLAITALNPSSLKVVEKRGLPAEAALGSGTPRLRPRPERPPHSPPLRCACDVRAFAFGSHPIISHSEIAHYHEFEFSS